MPESYQGENLSRAERLTRGPSNDCTQEYINVAIFKLSNKLGTDLSWEETLNILDASGIMSTRTQLDRHFDSLRTISALAEVLYQDALEYLYDSRGYEEPWEMQPRSVKLVIWLLSLGYRPDTYITLSPWPVDSNKDSKATGLQIAICCEDYELARALLDARANPNLMSHHIHPLHEDQLVLLPPLSIAVCCRNSPGRNAIIRRLLAAGAGIGAEQKRKRGFLVEVSTLSTIATCDFAEQEGAEIQKEIMDTLRIAQARFVTADVLIAAAWNGRMKNLELLLQINPDVNMTNSLGLTALHAAAFRGHADICSMLIQRGCYIDHPDQVAPSPLHLAAFCDHMNILAMLHQHGASLTRGITITEHNYAVVSSRYFLGVFHDDSEERSCSVKDWAEVKELALLLESPAGAAFHATDDESEGTLEYMMQYGASLPTSTIWFASCRQCPQLLSLALRENFNPNYRGPHDRTLLQRALVDGLDCENKPECAQIVSKLLDAGAMVVGGEAILALRNLGSWDTVERILSSDRDNLSERYDLIPQWRSLPFRIGATLLETSILGGSPSLIEHVLTLEPSQYSAEALCAACLHAVTGRGTLALVERLLQNRANIRDVDEEEDAVCETTAIGIAAWGGDSVMLETLHAYIPVSNLAYLPSGDPIVKLVSTAADPSHNPRLGPLSFWHAARFIAGLDLMGSPVNFALDKPKILGQLLKYGYKFDRVSPAIMADLGDTSMMRSFIQGRDILHNEFASRIHSPLYHAITNGHFEMSALLLDLGEDINDNEYQTWSGRNPLARAVEKNNLSLIEMLLKAGADVNVPPAAFRGMTALQCAAAQGSLGIAKQLIDLGADMNVSCFGNDSRTALQVAAERGRIDMVQLLLSEGVETTGKGAHTYLRAIALAKLRGHHVTANILKKHRPWTDEDRRLWHDQNLLPGYFRQEWGKDDDECFEMASAAEEEADDCRGHSAWGNTETSEEDDGMDWDPSDSTARNALSANGSNIMNQDVVAEPSFAIEMHGINVDAIDWDAFLIDGPIFINEDVSAEPWVVWDGMADVC